MMNGALHSDTQGSPSESRSAAALTGLWQVWNLLLHPSRKETTVDEYAMMIATERRVRRELYP
jgi:hypothetical protein